jgi:hypothetical protein
MKRQTSRLGAAFVFLAAAAAIAPALAAKSIEVPAYRQLGAAETMAAAGNNGTDYSANAPSLSGLTLLATIPAPLVPRLGYFIQAQCTAGLTLVFDDSAGSLTQTVAVLAGPSSNGSQGGSLSMSGMPHTGRIRIYSSSASCQMAARAW